MKQKLTRKFITFGRIIHTGMVNFIRNVSLGIAAIAVMVVTLTIVLFSVVANATFGNTITQITSRIGVSVYLKDDVSNEKAKEVETKLKALSSVKSVRYLDKQAALSRYLQLENPAERDSRAQAVAQSGINPIPATLLIKPSDLNQLGEIKTFLSRAEIAALQSSEPSYSGERKDAIDRITGATNTLRQIGIIAVGVFTVVSALIIFNTIQMAIFNRRDEITIMRLLGAKTNYIRGPFIVESIIYGLLSAFISIFIINSAFVASSSALQASSLGLLDISYASRFFGDNFLKLLTMQLVVGILIGTVSSVIATRRYLKFRVK